MRMRMVGIYIYTYARNMSSSETHTYKRTYFEEFDCAPRSFEHAVEIAHLAQRIHRRDDRSSREQERGQLQLLVDGGASPDWFRRNVRPCWRIRRLRVDAGA